MHHPVLIAAVFSPFSSDNALALGQVAHQAEWLASRGVDGVFVAGTTGESLSLSLPERMQLIETWAGVASSVGLSLFAHVGASSQIDSIALAQHADDVGVDAISAMAPNYFKPATCADLAAYLGEIASAASATPFYYYDIPSWTGVTFRSSEILSTFATTIPTLAGIKYTSNDWIDFARCVAIASTNYRLFWGCDEALLAGLVLGAHGAIGSTYNFAARQAREVVHAFQNNDFASAREAQLGVIHIVDALAQYDYLPAAKALMGILGVDCGPVRSPLRTLDHGQIQELRHCVTSLGLTPLKSHRG
ncbi:MAG: dihydrodipicolinate synthase family protein [Pirellulales bacterium]